MFDVVDFEFCVLWCDVGLDVVEWCSARDERWFWLIRTRRRTNDVMFIRLMWWLIFLCVVWWWWVWVDVVRWINLRWWLLWFWDRDDKISSWRRFRRTSSLWRRRRIGWCIWWWFVLMVFFVVWWGWESLLCSLIFFCVWWWICLWLRRCDCL